MPSCEYGFVHVPITRETATPGATNADSQTGSKGPSGLRLSAAVAVAAGSTHVASARAFASTK